MRKIVDGTLTATEDVRGGVAGGGLSLYEGLKCVTLTLICTAETKERKRNEIRN